VKSHPAVHVLDHPLLKVHLAAIRDRRSDSPSFRQHLHAAARILALEAARSLETRSAVVETPLEAVEGAAWVRPLVLVPILRAGLGFLHGFLEILPHAQVGHVGLARNETTLQPESYYTRLPRVLPESDVFLLDPMLATGGSSAAAIQLLKDTGATRITFCCLVACPEGLSVLAETHPDVPVIAASCDRQLNDRGFILPGLGDAGDRYFGTD
jgi:uracil phosphoribosyltransferase